MIKHFSFAYPYLLILHIFFIFTSFYRIQAQNILDKNLLLLPSFKETISKKNFTHLNTQEQQALYVFKAQSAFEQKNHATALQWTEKISNKGFFAPIKPYLKFKIYLQHCQELLNSPVLTQKTLKSFNKSHNSALQYIKYLNLALLPGLKQDIHNDLKQLMFHNYLHYFTQKDKLSIEHPYLLSNLDLNQEQQKTIEKLIQAQPNKKHRAHAQKLLQKDNFTQKPINITEKVSSKEDDASIIYFNQIAPGSNKKNIEHHLKLLSLYPNSQGAQKSLNAILTACKQNAKSTFLTLYYSKQTPLPFELFYKTGHILWNQTLYSYAQMAFEKALMLNAFHKDAHKASFYMARINEDQLKWDQAKQAYMQFVATYPSSDLYKRSIFKLGLISYILNQEEKSRRYLNTFYSLADSANEKGQALYWQLKLAQKFNQKNRVDSLKQALQKEAPLSFYAAKEKLWPDLFQSSNYSDSISPQSKLYSAYIWTLAGFKHLAIWELEKLSSLDYLDKEFINYLNLWHANQDHTTPVILAYRAIHSKSSPSPIDKRLISSVFPKQYSQQITSTAKNLNLSNELVLAIIKQESAFNPKAKSPAGAYGLMQLMPNTAKQFFKLIEQEKSFDEKFLYEPETNIKLGKLYLQKLIQDYDDNLIYIASNYNAGANPLKTWRSRWNSLDEDLFIEMIPYKETRNYVKLVLRNYYFYHFLNHKNIDK
ncbi:MAG TPA: transglycosylase SLT domain-containing protein [Oligoflexia bacterium]|nr:transglycosylase SLT domain-containing protein [Oligoflexia bacterium]HMR24058.1 transglycosylase SLT domain-containing protein [Oligoflexia bacterium]